MRADTPWSARWWRGWGPLITIAILYGTLLAGVAAKRTSGISHLTDYEDVKAASTSDFRDFWFTARHLRNYGLLTDEFGVHNYLPFFTLFMLPWSFLPLPLAAGLFTLMSLGLFALTVVLVEALLGNGLGRPRPATWAAVLLALPYVHACLVVGNLGLLLLFLVVAAWYLIEHEREWEAGALLGLGALIKLLPLAIVLFLLFRRRWRVGGGALATLLLLGLVLPTIALSWRQTADGHAAFLRSALHEHSAVETLTAAEPLKTLYSNTSLPMVVRRLLTPTDSKKGAENPPLLVNIMDVPPPVRVGVYILIAALIGGATLAVTFRGPLRWPPDSEAEVRRLRAVFGAWCAVLLLAAPLVWTHYLPLVYWVLALLADRVERVRRATHRIAVVPLGALLLWGGAIVSLAIPAARAAGAPLAGILVVWGACLWLATRPDRDDRRMPRVTLADDTDARP